MQPDKWQPLLTTVTSVQKYRWLKHSVQGVFPQSSLMATIVEFALKEEPLDVEKMRKCLLKQVIRTLGQIHRFSSSKRSFDSAKCPCELV